MIKLLLKYTIITIIIFYIPVLIISWIFEYKTNNQVRIVEEFTHTWGIIIITFELLCTYKYVRGLN